MWASAGLEPQIPQIPARLQGDLGTHGTFPEGLDPSVRPANSWLGGKRAVGPLNSESGLVPMLRLLGPLAACLLELMTLVGGCEAHGEVAVCDSVIRPMLS